MTEFEKFLKKSAYHLQDDGVLVATGKRDADLIHVKDLGEWAWKDIVPIISKLDFLFFDYIDAVDKHNENNLLWNIAVACLGREEVARRLKELEK